MNENIINNFLSKALIVFSAFLTSPSLFAEGDAKAGKEKAITCHACHGEDGIGKSPLWPNLSGQKDQYLIKQLKAFRSGDRKDPLMEPMAKPLSDADIENLAAYYSSLK